MITYNTYFSSVQQFQTFLNTHAIKDNDQLLIQIFTALTDREDILKLRDSIHTLLPAAKIIGATTDGEICSGTVSTGETVISISQFEHTQLKNILVENCTESFQTGKTLASTLTSPRTKLLITFTDGLRCNAEQYLNGITSVNDTMVIAGGMAGDNANFQQTFVFTQTDISNHGAVGIALESERLSIHTDYRFNWQPVGRNMTVTKVEENRLYTIDHTPAYEVYRHYLGKDVADKLPATGVELPLIIKKGNDLIARAALIRHKDGSITYSGNFHVGDQVSFGYGNTEMILEQSINTQNHLDDHLVESIFIYSCMGRRRFMPDLIENEIRPFQNRCEVAGFFTYGEFFTFPEGKELLNQTMTILALSESLDIEESDIQSPQEQFIMKDDQKSIKALSHLLNITIKEMSEENALLEEEKKRITTQQESMRFAQKVGHFGTWEIELKSGKAHWSIENYHIYGIEPGSIDPTLDTFISLVLPEDQKKVFNVLKNIEDGETKTLTVRVTRTDGEIIHVLISGKILFDEEYIPTTLIGTTLDITQQVILNKEKEEFASIIENSSNEIYIVDKETYQYLYVNHVALDQLGYNKEEMSQMILFDVKKDMTVESVRKIEQKIKENRNLLTRNIQTKKNGKTYPVQSYIQYTTYQNRDVAIFFDIDITNLVEAEYKQKTQAQILKQIYDSIIVTDLHDMITYWNNGATIMHGYDADEMLAQPIKKLYVEEEIPNFQRFKEQALSLGAFQGEIKKRTKNGKIIHTHISISTIKDETGQIMGLTYYSQDITRRKEIEEQLKRQTELLDFQAHHDALTQLPNRILFEKRLEEALVNGNKYDIGFGILFIDLDNFKQINDTHGHHYGDEVLKITAKRLVNSIRKHDTLARLGGDEFTMLISEADTSAIRKIAQKVIYSLEEVFIVEKQEFYISASIGISLYPEDAQSKNDLLKYADIAMYKAKDNGRNNYQCYSKATS